jgi:hypothetical protein
MAAADCAGFGLMGRRFGGFQLLYGNKILTFENSLPCRYEAA